LALAAVWRAPVMPITAPAKGELPCC
jgi:hypothetical protein